MDIDVEHEGQRTKVTTPLQSEKAEKDLGAEAKDGGEVKSDCNTSEGTKVSSSETFPISICPLRKEGGGGSCHCPPQAKETGRPHSCVFSRDTGTLMRSGLT